MPQKPLNVPESFAFENRISFEEKVNNKQIINAVTLPDALYHVSYMFSDLTNHTRRSASRAIL